MRIFGANKAQGVIIMSFFRRLRERLHGKGARLRDLGQDAQLLMKRVQLTGHCECLWTHGADGGLGYLLIVHADQIIPLQERELIGQYFRRKLADPFEGEAQQPLRVMIRDGHDALRAQAPPTHVNATRVISIVNAANAPASSGNPLATRLAEMRQQMAANRQQRAEERADDEDDGYAPTQQLPRAVADFW
jgi:hypothetical protein